MHPRLGCLPAMFDGPMGNEQLLLRKLGTKLHRKFGQLARAGTVAAQLGPIAGQVRGQKIDHPGTKCLLLG
jgi:hypothetical protein